MKSGYSGYSGAGVSGYSGFSGYSDGADTAVMEAPPTTKKGYYETREEEAVVKFITSTSEDERRALYNGILKKPIDKMIDSIIRTYGLYRKDYTFTDLHADALSFLITKFDKFDSTMGKKSFSYFGTICRNYLYGEKIKAYKKFTRTVDYEDAVTELMERPDMITHIDKEEIDMNHFIDKLIGELKVELEDTKLSENEQKIGLSLIEILENWTILFDNFIGTPKFNKNLILLYLRNMTGLTTKEIRNAMRRFKSLYYLFKDNYIT
jgi:hypothetical protein